MTKVRVAILALQGAFAEHRQMLNRLGVESVLIRNLNDWKQFVASVGPTTSLPTEASSGLGLISPKTPSGLGLILPGGESTAMMRILHDEALFEPVSEAIRNGLPTFGTCAGMILLDASHLNCMDIIVRRNAYGRQLGSFYTEHTFEGIGTIPMTFIRAPYIEQCGTEVEVLSVLDGHIVAARQGNMLATSFHPELNDDTRVHELFISMIMHG